MPSRFIHDAADRRLRVMGVALLLLAGGQAPSPVAAATAAGPVVVELFQSQGCSSCPPANANLNALAARPDLLALSFGVTYWDQLGWKDSFAKPAYTQRQRDYAHARGREKVWTPQVYINGRTDIVGRDRAEFDAAIARASATTTAAPKLGIGNGRVAVGAANAPAGGGDVWLVRYDPRTIAVPIRAGENGGRTLPHRNVVRELVKLGRWTGQAASFAIPAASQQGLATAAFIQAGVGGPILVAAKA